MAKARTIIEEPEVEKELAAASKKFPRFEQVWNGWTWRLARGPLDGAVAVSETNPPAYLVKAPDFGHYEDLPAAVVILFELPDDDHVVLIAVSVS
ncbi:MAG TPA: hypothetical protein VJV79_30695 [Polyangiaceae bacterium]|nr:hypothetical protein [Polyangiaceae bacterium]